MNLLITGGEGFIGSNFICYLLNRHTVYYVINLDKLTYAGSLENLEEVIEHPRQNFFCGDVFDLELVENIFSKLDIKGGIHFAVESHVDNSIGAPVLFVRTNYLGTLTLLDVARNYWLEAPGKYKRCYDICRFHYISTDEVYGSLGSTGLFTEKFSYAPSSHYSTSKAGSDLLAHSYFHTYGLNRITTNCSNNYGPMQHREKLIPTIIRKASALEQITIYGDGKNIRDWLYELDHCRGIDIAYHKAKAGETYNIGGRNERENIYNVNRICEALDELAPEI